MYIDGLIQVAGIRGLDEARLVLECGADLLGFPLRLPVHAPDLSEAAARVVIGDVGADSCVLITYETDPGQLVDLCRFLRVRVLQLHSGVSPEILATIRTSTDVSIIKSYVVGREELGPQEFVRRYAPYCDAFITDTFDPTTGASGATGRTHDWAISADLVQASLRPVILAGGLHPGNVREAIMTVRPAGVDVHSGVEAPDGSKNPDLLRAFIREARAAFAETFSA